MNENFDQGQAYRWFVMLLFTHGSYNIFNDAMAAVLKMMDNNFSAEFQETEAYKNLEKVVEEEAEELERLRRVRCTYNYILHPLPH